MIISIFITWHIIMIYTFHNIVSDSFSPYSNLHTRLLIQSILTSLCLIDEFQIAIPPNSRAILCIDSSIVLVVIISELYLNFNSLLRAVSYKLISCKKYKFRITHEFIYKIQFITRIIKVFTVI